MKKNKKGKGRELQSLGKDPEAVLLALRAQAMRHTLGFFHYTIVRNLAKMLRPVEVEGVARYMFKLSPAESLNDAAERHDGLFSYILSFSHGPEENVSMWTTYGIPRTEAVRLRFPKKAVRLWVEKAERDPQSVCFVTRKGIGSIVQYERVRPLWIRFADVLYVVRKGRPSDCLAEHDGRMKKCPGGLNWIDFANSRQDVGLVDFFKNRGWAYERETRIVVAFEKCPTEKADDSVFIDFSSVFQAMLKDRSTRAKENILLGPWFNSSEFHKKLNSKIVPDSEDWLSLDGVVDGSVTSAYQGELKMPTNCSRCNRSDKLSCVCDFKELQT